MPYIRPALVEMFTLGGDPWNTLVQWCTLNPIALSHSPVVVIDIEEGTHTIRGRQLLHSIPREHPWGFIPRCGKPSCPSRPGDVWADGTNNQTHGVHGSMLFYCKRCRYTAKVTRPTFITHAHKDRPYYFVTPWPLTAAQLDIATGYAATWAPASGKYANLGPGTFAG